MNKDFLLEILTQELPYKFIPSAVEQLKDAFKKLFLEQGLKYQDIKVYATPRRLAVLVSELSDKQDALIKEIKGPVLSVAKDELGNFTKAGLGFLAKNNIKETDVFEKDNYIWAKIEITGKNTVDILKDSIENVILKLQGAHFMRWGSNSVKFSRPVENVVALFGSDVVELKIFDKTATNKTQGHRYSKNRYVVIDEPKNYVDILKSAQVFVNQEERKQLIVDKVTKCAKENNLEVKLDDLDELLEEITFITEYPVCVLCDFDEKYLQIPPIVSTTVMTQHQRYFPLWDKAGNLSNHFITIANYVGDDFSNIKAGNQRVICARLEDGVFFFKEDTKTKLIDKIDNLKGMTFQKGLGTLFDKTQRMIKISSKLAGLLNIQNKEDILRCAQLSKCDLSTKLVFEFTELQGFIGQNYAQSDGEKPAVSKGICEHYFPLSANSPLASEITGQIVSIADKVDTINALFISTQGDKKKKRPTGSNDPLGARRSAIGILRTLIEKKINLNLQDIIKYSLDLLSDEFSIPLEETILDELKEFYLSRLIFMYEKQYSSNVLLACLGANPLSNLNKTLEKIEILSKYQKNPLLDNFSKLKENALRISKILKGNDFSNVDNSLLIQEEEKNLYNAIKNHNSAKDDIENYIKSLSDLIAPVEKFFDKVLVMDKDEKIKNNRIALLNLLKEKFTVVCDFEKL